MDNATRFATLCRKEKDDALRDYLSANGESAVSEQIRALNLSPDQMQIMRQIVDDVLTDTYITLLYALDGSASIWGGSAGLSDRK